MKTLLRLSYYTGIIILFVTLFNSKNAFSKTINQFSIEDSIIFSKFHRSKTISFSTLLKIESSFIRQMFFFNNKIVLTSLDDNDPYVFNLFNPLTNKVEKGFIKRGDKLNESVAPLSSGIINNEIIWLHDVSLSKILKVKSSDIGSGDIQITTDKLQNPYTSAQVIDEYNIYAYSGMHGSDKLQKINMTTNKEKESFGKFENKPANLSEQSWKQINEGFIFIKPTKDKIVFANKLIDKFSILDTLSENSISVIGPSKFTLNVEIAKTQGRDVIITNETTRRSYINGYCTNRFIYLLHTNNFEMHPKADQGNEIFVFDWYGNAICRYSFNNEISCFLIDEINKVIYAYDPDTREILKGDLSL